MRKFEGPVFTVLDGARSKTIMIEMARGVVRRVDTDLKAVKRVVTLISVREAKALISELRAEVEAGRLRQTYSDEFAVAALRRSR